MLQIVSPRLWQRAIYGSQGNNLRQGKVEKVRLDEKCATPEAFRRTNVQVAKMIEGSGAVADELLEKMDKDRDGKVVRAEFEDSFTDLVFQVFNMKAVAISVAQTVEEEAERRSKEVAERRWKEAEQAKEDFRRQATDKRGERSQVGDKTRT